MNSLWNAVVSGASWPIETVAGALGATGSWAWGWAVVLVAAGWRLLVLPLVVRQGNRRILTARWHAVHSRGRDLRGRQERAQVHGLVRESLSRRVAPAGGLANVVGALQVLTMITVAVWSRGSEAAATHGFGGLAALDRMTITLGAAGWTWAVTLGLLFLVSAILTHGAAGCTTGHQTVIERILAPAFFTALGLLVPAAVTVAFVTGMAVSLTGLVIASVAVQAGQRAPAGQVA